MARVTINDCLDKINNHFELVLVAAVRAREILSGKNPTIAREGSTVAVIALREIAETTIDIERIKNNLPIIFSNNDNGGGVLHSSNIDTSLDEEGIVSETDASNLLVIEESGGDKLLSSD